MRLVRRVGGNEQTLLSFDEMKRLDKPDGPPLDFRHGLYTLIAAYSAADGTLEAIVQDGLGVNQFRARVVLDQALPAASSFGISSWSANGTSALDDFVVLSYQPVETVGTLLELSSPELEIDESAGTVVATARRTGEGAGAVEVDYTVREMTAWNGVDFGMAPAAPLEGTLFWAAGDTSDKSIEIPILDDMWVEIDETFAIRLGATRGPAALGDVAEATVRIVDDDRRPSVCSPSEHQLCLAEQRFQVEGQWRTAQGLSGPCHAVALSADSGYCWFFDDSNAEVLIKVLDACAPPFEHFWVFAAGLTNIETTLVVLDTVSGELRRYDNQQGRAFRPIQDTNAFSTCP